MAVQRWRALESDVLVKPGIQSRQLVWPKNSPESQTTITHVTMEPGAVSDRHAHQRSEQIWIVERGEGLLLLENEHSEVLRAGDIVRTPAGENAWGSEQRTGAARVSRRYDSATKFLFRLQDGRIGHRQLAALNSLSP
jgi:quercetin dioxygenase-like cupin family protein